ncbi:hypothetical protein [Paenibacillus apiarius]|uniref:hypothetical protein n=1 Tax=Paenibacillus apiarius TaxID=46240 RepID=UPI003B3AEFC7
MNAYEKVFSGYSATLSPEDLKRESRVFYVNQVHIILSWIDLTDSEQLKKIRELDNAFRVIVEG